MDSEGGGGSWDGTLVLRIRHAPARRSASSSQAGRRVEVFKPQTRAPPPPPTRTQAALAEAEEFERADALSSVVAHIKQETALRATALQELALEANALDREKGVRRGEQLACLRDTARALAELRAEQVSCARGGAARHDTPRRLGGGVTMPRCRDVTRATAERPARVAAEIVLAETPTTCGWCDARA